MENGSGQEQRLRGETHRVAVAMGTGAWEETAEGIEDGWMLQLGVEGDAQVFGLDSLGG